MREKETCCVADQYCIAAANFEGADCRTQCLRCGQAVCIKCSSMRNYYGLGAKSYPGQLPIGNHKARLCNDCQIELDDPGHKNGGRSFYVTRRLYRLSGMSYTKNDWIKELASLT